MSLSTLYLFRDVAITRDYSVVHDLTVAGWRNKLLSITSKIVVDGMTVNYYRLPDSIVITIPYEDARKASYGMLDIVSGTGTKTIYFWVDSCRLVKQAVDDAGNDTVSFNVSEDIWSSYSEGVYLHDSYIVRRHMPRWDGSDPLYYPGASQGVDGAYKLEKTEDLTPGKTFTGFTGTFDFRFIVVSVLGTDGQLKMYIGMECVKDETAYEIYSDYGNSKKIFGLKEVLDGSAFTAFGISAQYVQSITVVPYMSGIDNAVTLQMAGGDFYFLLNDSSAYFQGFSVSSSGTVAWIKPNFELDDLWRMMASRSTTVENVLPSAPSSAAGTEYDDTQEPMLYRYPARQRKVVNGMGGSVVDVPDIAAFGTSWTCRNSFDTSAAITFVYPEDDIEAANAIGALGVVQAATLPIFESAWKTYEAISKTGDDISYNASQISNAINGIVGVVSGIAGAMAGGVGGAVAGTIGGTSAASGLTSLYTTEEDLKAKRTTIRNSPCTVVSSGSGLGAFVLDLIDIHFVTLKMDDVSMRKLSDQYYFYGYFVNATAHGTVDLKTRETFDFIQTAGARVDGDAPGDVLEEMRSIFDRGVTIYHDYNAIGTGKVKPNREITTTAGASNA